MTQKIHRSTWAVVGWIAFGLGQIVAHDPFTKFFLLAVARGLP